MHSQSTQRSFFLRFQRSRAWSWIKPASSFTLELQVSDLRCSVSKAKAMERVSSCSRAERYTQRMWRGYCWAILYWENTKKKPGPSTTAESCHPDRWIWCKTPSNSLSNLTLALKCILFQVSFIIQWWAWEMLAFNGFPCNSVCVFHPEPVRNTDGEICTVKTQEILEGNVVRESAEGHGNVEWVYIRLIFKLCLAALKNHKHFTP